LSPCPSPQLTNDKGQMTNIDIVAAVMLSVNEAADATNNLLRAGGLPHNDLRQDR